MDHEQWVSMKMEHQTTEKANHARALALLLIFLHNAFPVKVSTNLTDLENGINYLPNETPTITHFKTAVQLLLDEKFIRVDQGGGKFAAENLVLTPLGYTFVRRLATLKAENNILRVAVNPKASDFTIMEAFDRLMVLVSDTQNPAAAEAWVAPR